MSEEHPLIDLAKRCKALTHMSRAIDKELHDLTGSQFRYPYTGSLDSAKWLVPDGFVWCAGTAWNDDGSYAWANVHDYGATRIPFDCSVHAATPEIALCAASCVALAALQGVTDHAQ